MTPAFLNVIWYFYVAFTGFLWPRGAGCPPGDCFQTHCWGLSIAETGVFTAHCEGIDEIFVNTLDLGLCIGVEQGVLLWQDGGNFTSMARDISITHDDQYKGFPHIELEGQCAGHPYDKEGEYGGCTIDLSERIAFDGGWLSCLAHPADVKGPYPFISYTSQTEKHQHSGDTKLGSGDPVKNGYESGD